MLHRVSLAIVFLFPIASLARAQDKPAATPATIVRLTIDPSEIVLQGQGARQQILVTAYYADGALCDVTAQARLVAQDTEHVRIAGSVVHGKRDGETRIVAEFGGQTSAPAGVRVQDADKPTPLSFQNDIMPILSRSGCNQGTCHGNFNGKNGFRLSLRGESAVFDLDSLSRDTQGRRCNVFDPDKSLVLQKPTGQMSHEGGMRFGKNSHEYTTLRQWIAAGMPADAPATAKLTKLEAWPRDRVLWHGADKQQLVARATFSDGSVRDVTHQAVFEPSVESVKVSATGVLHAEKPGEATVVVRFLDQRMPCRVAFVPERPDFQFPQFKAAHYIDKQVFARLKELQVEPSELTDDAGFLRRAFLDVCGVLPTPAEVKSFLADKNPNKRERLIDQLLNRPEYADYWSLQWADLLRNEEKAVDAKGVRLFRHWLKQRIGDDTPLDQFVRALLTSRGSTYENPQANYYRTNLEPNKAAETTALVFLGVRIACAKCHNHPFDRWTQDDYHGLSAFFARVKTRMVENKRRDKLDKHELVGEMIVYMDREGEVKHPTTGDSTPPRLLDGRTLKLDAGADRLPALADWIASKDNRQFARVLANRIWFHLMGRGLVEPVDEFRESNPASHAALLDALAKDLVEHNFSQKHLIRTIMRSQSYQLSSKPKPTNKEDTHFSRVEPKLLNAEVLLDAICQVTAVPEAFKGYPVGLRAVQLPGVLGGPSFLKRFGRPDRLLACECERQSETTLGQAMTMINSETVLQKVQDSPRLARLLDQKTTNQEIISEFYLAALSRYPTERELETIGTRLDAAADRRAAVEDLLWAVINTKEFLLRR
ncbi:MAG: DUF1549 and DUF1553 domain-containing protein [Gemmataceae bacterium]|nr:DUF1549 and DUF1553 domain-containing protein [Gemmataceae bacterium]MCI0739286.1 DUF1549 and DUF1553 domain-containing protein [Gemmataceae bacterium]